MVVLMSNYLLSTEEKLATEYIDLIQPFWESQVIQSQFVGLNDLQIAYAYALNPNPVGSIVLSSGRIESLVKYKEVIFDLYQNGYSVFVHDHRGQGLSGRMINNTHMGYVDSFDDYIIDFKSFIDRVVLVNSQSKPKLLCHSMGGAIGAKLILAYPNMFEKVAFSAPMFGIRPPLPNWFSELLLRVHAVLKSPEAYFFGQKDYENQPFVDNDLTHSEVRYQIFRQEYELNPSIQLGGVTGQWLSAAAKAMHEIENCAAEFAIPALVLQAGSDQIVDNKRQARVTSKMANTTMLVIDDARHELLEESDAFRTPSLNAILDFFAQKTTP
jgi:lysophospholipase